jgi:hypothetical protein
VIGLEINVIIRYVAQDDPRQSPAATRLMRLRPRFDKGAAKLASFELL